MKEIVKVAELDHAIVNALKVEHLEKGVYKIHQEKGYFIIEVLDFNPLTKEMKVRYKHNVHVLAFKKPVDEILDQLGIKPAAAAANTDVKAPMPGKVLQIMVSEGDSVLAGAPILVLEAMKMENVLKAEIDGVVKKINAIKDNNVEKNQILVELDIA